MHFSEKENEAGTDLFYNVVQYVKTTSNYEVGIESGQNSTELNWSMTAFLFLQCHSTIVCRDLNIDYLLKLKNCLRVLFFTQKEIKY